MRTPASIARHPIHPMLIPLPIGLWVFALVCDLIFVLGDGDPLWLTLSFYSMIGGLIGAILAAIPGTIDMMSLSGTPKKLALTHMALNVAVVVLFAVNIAIRVGATEIAGLPLALSIIGVSLLGASGWLGGHMVYVHRVAVDDSDSVSRTG